MPETVDYDAVVAAVRKLANRGARRLDYHGWPYPDRSTRDEGYESGMEVAVIVTEDLLRRCGHRPDEADLQLTVDLVRGLLCEAARQGPELHKGVDRGLVYAILRQIEYLPAEDIAYPDDYPEPAPEEPAQQHEDDAPPASEEEPLADWERELLYGNP